MSARIEDISNFNGGRIGCRTSPSRLGIGMLDSIFWEPSHNVFPSNKPEVSDRIERYEYTGLLRIEERVVRLNRWMRHISHPSEFLAKSRGAMTVSFGNRVTSYLQTAIRIRNSERLSRFGVFFVGTDGGALTEPQTCIQVFDDIQLTVFYRLP